MSRQEFIVWLPLGPTGRPINMGTSRWWTPVYRTRKGAAEGWPSHEIVRATFSYDPPPKKSTKQKAARAVVERRAA